MKRRKFPFAIALCAATIGAQAPAPEPSSAPAEPPQPAASPSAAPAPQQPAAGTPAPAAGRSSDAPAAAPAKDAPAPAAAAPVSGEGSSSAAASTSPEDQGFHFHPGATFGTLTVDGKTWTRLSFTPEVSFGKLGVGFNLELFMDQNQNLSTRGWDFDTRRNGLESVLRKFDYVRWDHPGAPFYARLGTLEGIDLGYGLVASGFGNMARYPDYKELGLDVQFNDWTAVGLDVEVVANNVQDLQNGGPVTAFKVGLRPLKPLGIPVLGGLVVRTGAAYDWNQYAGLRDQDGDGCPDVVDASPNDRSSCVPRTDVADLPHLDPSLPTSENIAKRNSYDSSRADSVRNKYSARKPFGVYWVEASLPVVTSNFFGLELHSAFAKPETQDPDAASAGWGAIPLGAGAHVGPITLTAEYRVFDQPFQPGYFDDLYEIQRAQFVGNQVVTKEMLIYGKDVAQKGMMQGYFASAGWDVFGFLKAGADYSDLFPSKADQDELRAIGAKAALGPKITGLLQNRISLAEVYWRKDRIGLDRWVVDGAEHHDGFLDLSTFTVYGCRVGSQVAPGLTLVVDRQTSYVRNLDGTLSKENQMRIETQMKF